MDPHIWTIIGNFFLIALITILCIRIFRWGNRRLFHMLTKGEKEAYDPTSFSFIQNGLSFTLVLLGFFVFLFGIPALRQYGEKIFVGAGLATIAIGFASQAALSNIVGGIFIVLFRPFRVNDIITVNLHTGVVEDITLRHTVIRNFENRRIVIPNSVISSETILNSSIGDARICNFFEVTITFDSDIDQAIAIIKREAMKHPNFIDNRSQEDIATQVDPVIVRTINWLDRGVQLRANIWTLDPPSGFQLKCDLYLTLLKIFAEAGIEIAYPHQVNVVKNSDSLP